jgi:hypothetical protein
MSTMRRSRPAVVAAAVMTVLAVPAAAATAAAAPAAASPAVIEVALGTHAFGALTPAEAVVARVGPDGVGWVEGQEGVSYGPGSFEVAANGTVWLLDEVNDRLLSWRRGLPNEPVSTVPVPVSSVAFALGPNGTFYVTTHRPGETMTLNSITADGTLRWRAPLAADVFNAQLRMGPDRVLYQVTTESWIPVTDASGSPLSVSDQQRLTLPYQPLAGGRRLQVTASSAREIRVVLSDAAGQTVRTWRVTGKTDMALPVSALPAAIGNDVVLPLDVFRSTPSWRMEQLALRLTASGAPVQLHLRNAFWGDVPVTEYRAGPDGAFYQLQTSRTTGVTIARYGLTPAAAPTPTGGVVVPPAPASPSAPAATPAATPPVTPAVPAPARDESSAAWLIWTGGAGLVVVAAAVVAYLVWRRRRRMAVIPEAPTDDTLPMAGVR